MAAPADVIREMEMLGIGEGTSSDADTPSSGAVPSNGAAPSNGANGKHAESVAESIARQKEAVVNISKMADRMSASLQEVRDTAREANDRLKQLEVDLALLDTEEY
jgi:methyl-accepting chemotaxis protein